MISFHAAGFVLVAGAAFLIAAHRFFAPSTIAFRAAGLIWRFLAAGFVGEAFAALGFDAALFLGAAFAAWNRAHLRLDASAMALRPAALIVRFRGAAFEAGAARPAADVARGAPPRAGPCKASIARERRSRSAISKVTICSVDICENSIKLFLREAITALIGITSNHVPQQG
ncbi:MAG TPA: hypothetical protein VMB85_10370 [Bryobacteraceae bacterium]|nr:hypothetical protein [Bryobacteraceae bacterium]